jgi:hypothetical protein
MVCVKIMPVSFLVFKCLNIYIAILKLQNVFMKHVECLTDDARKELNVTVNL